MLACVYVYFAIGGNISDLHSDFVGMSDHHHLRAPRPRKIVEWFDKCEKREVLYVNFCSLADRIIASHIEHIGSTAGVGVEDHSSITRKSVDGPSELLLIFLENRTKNTYTRWEVKSKAVFKTSCFTL